MQNNSLSLREISSLLQIENTSHSLISGPKAYERDFRSRIKYANSFSLSTQTRERTKHRRSFNKNV